MWPMSDISVWSHSSNWRSPVLTGLLLDEFQADVVEHHEAETDRQQDQVAGVQRIVVQAHGLHNLGETVRG